MHDVLGYPWRRQIICLVLAVVGVIAYVVLVPLDLSFHLETSVFELKMLLFIPFILVMALITIAPVVSFRLARKRLHQTASICGRCEKKLLSGTTIARYGSEYICEECAKHMEDIQGEELHKFNKPEGM